MSRLALFAVLWTGCADSTMPSDDTEPSEEPEDTLPLEALQFEVFPASWIVKAGGASPNVTVDFTTPDELPVDVLFTFDPPLAGASIDVLPEASEKGDVDLILVFTEEAPPGEHVVELTATAPGYDVGSFAIELTILEP